MADLLDIISFQHQQANINLEKLNRLCLKKNVWDHFNITRAEFFELSDNTQQYLISRFYFDHFNDLHSIDDSIGEIIKNSDGSSFKEVNDDASNKTEKKFKSTSYECKSMSYELKSAFQLNSKQKDEKKNEISNHVGTTISKFLLTIMLVLYKFDLTY